MTDKDPVTVSARLSDAGVGLLDVWHSIHGRGSTGEGWITPGKVWDRHDNVNLSNPQISFGTALLLEKWERFGDNRANWMRGVANTLLLDSGQAAFRALAEKMAARITQIGMDHTVRRVWGEEPKPGTLASMGLMSPHQQWWRFDAREHGGAFAEWDRSGQFIGSAGIPGGAPNIPALADITDPIEGLAALYRRLTDE